MKNPVTLYRLGVFVAAVCGTLLYAQPARADCMPGDDWAYPPSPWNASCDAPYVSDSVYFHIYADFEGDYYDGRITWSGKMSANEYCINETYGWTNQPVYGDPRTLEGGRISFGFNDRGGCMHTLSLYDTDTSQVITGTLGTRVVTEAAVPTCVDSCYLGTFGTFTTTTTGYVVMYAQKLDVDNVLQPFAVPLTYMPTILGSVDGEIEPTSIVLGGGEVDGRIQFEFESTTTQDITFGCEPISNEYGYFTCDTVFHSQVDGGAFLDDIEVYYSEIGFIDKYGNPISAPIVPIEGGTYPLRYNFDGTGCDIGIVSAFYRIYYPDKGALPEYPSVANWTAYVYPQATTFNGIVNVPIPARQPGQTYDIMFGQTCFQDNTEIVDIHTEFTGLGLVDTDSPCDNLSALDLPGVFSCGWWRFTNLVNDVFVPSDISATAVNDFKNNLMTKFPFILFDGFITQWGILADMFDVTRGTIPSIVFESTYMNLYLEIDLSPFETFWNLLYIAQEFMIIFGCIWYIASDLHIVGQTGSKVTHYDNDSFI